MALENVIAANPGAFTPEEQKILQGLSFQGGSSVLGGGLTQYFTSGGKQFATNLPGGGENLQNARAYLDTIKRQTSDIPLAAPSIPIPTQTVGQPQAVSTVQLPTGIKPGERTDVFQSNRAELAGKPATFQPPPPVSSYTGPSIVDYLKSIGQPSDFASRTQLANKRGIQNYTGTVEQNTSLLNQLRGANTVANAPNRVPGVTSGYTPTPAIPGQDFAAYEASQGFPQTGTQTPSTNQGGFINEPANSVQSQIGLPEDLTSTSIEDVISKVSNYFGFTEINNQMKELDNKYIDDVAHINDNPWITEGIRQKEIEKLKLKHEQRKDALVNRLRLQEGVVGKGLEVYFREREFKKELLFKELDFKSRQLERQAREERFDISQAATESRFQRNLQVRVQQKAEKADVLGRLEKSLGTLKTLGQTRQGAETKFKNDNGISNIPANISSVFDKVFGPTVAQNKPWWQLW